MFQNLFAKSLARRRPSQFRPGFESLESRVTPVLDTFGFHVNTTTALAQTEAVSASSTNGWHVVVWTHQASATNTDIRAQVYTTRGTKFGGELRIASSRLPELQPSVTMDGQDRFYVSYTQQTTSRNKDIIVTNFTREGARLGTTKVATSTKNEYDSSIASNRFGEFIVTYTVDTSASNQDILGKRYTKTGLLLSSFSVANSPTADETASSAARSVSFNLVQHDFQSNHYAVAYVVNGKDVFLRRYNGLGAALGTHAIATTSSIETNPSVALTYYGNCVVSFQRLNGSQWDIFARRVSSSGTLSANITVRVGTSQDTDATIDMKHSDGSFAVVYQSRKGNSNSVLVSEFSPTGVARGGPFVVANVKSLAAKPSVSVGNLATYIIAFTELNGPSDPSYGVFARRGALGFVRA